MYRSAVVLSSSLCQFTECTFLGRATGKDDYISTKSTTLSFSFVSCLFDRVDATEYNAIIMIANADKGVLDRCCFTSGTSNTIYGCYNSDTSFLNAASANGTVCVNFYANWAGYWGSPKDFTYYYNNHTYLRSRNWRACYCMVTIPPNRDDINCFFSGTCCSGHYTGQFQASVNNCVMSRFNFVNNTDRDGLFWLDAANVKTIIKNSVISLSESASSPKWIWSSSNGASLEVLNSYVVGRGSLTSQTKVSSANVEIVKYARTYNYFKQHPHYEDCNSATDVYSYKRLPNSFSTVFLLLVIGTLLFE